MPSSANSRATCRIPVKAAGPLWPPSKKRFLATCFRLRCMPASARARITPSRRRCSRACATSSAGTWSVPRAANARRINQLPERFTMETVDQTQNTAELAEEAGRPGDPCVMVIFGASGDLTKRKLIPALYNLAKDNLLAKEFALIGFARNELTSEQFREQISAEISQFATTKLDPDLWNWLSRRIYYIAGVFDDPKKYQELATLLPQFYKQHRTGPHYFYFLAPSPTSFPPSLHS